MCISYTYVVYYIYNLMGFTFIYIYMYVFMYIHMSYANILRKKNSGGKVAQPKRTQLKHFVPGQNCPMQRLHNSILARLYSEYIYFMTCRFLYTDVALI